MQTVVEGGGSKKTLGVNQRRQARHPEGEKMSETTHSIQENTQKRLV